MGESPAYVKNFVVAEVTGLFLRFVTYDGNEAECRWTDLLDA